MSNKGKQRHDRHDKLSTKKQGVKGNVKPDDVKPDSEKTQGKIKPDNPITSITVHKGTGETEHRAEDSQGNLVLTADDKVRYEKAQAKQAKARQLKIDAKQAVLEAQEALQALNGSDSIKAIKQDIEKRLKAQEEIVSKLTKERDIELEKLQVIQSQYQALTGIDNKAKASTKKSGNGKANGKFETTIVKEADCLNVMVKHKGTNTLFEYSLYPKNGNIDRQDWIKLRHSLTAQFEKDTKEEDLTIRAYLSNLKGKIDSIKTIK